MGLLDGEIKVIGKVAASSDRAVEIASWLEKSVGAGRPVWVGVFHGNAPQRGEQLAQLLERRFRVAYRVVRPLSASIYMHLGPGAVGAVVVPVDDLPFAVSPPS